MRIGPIRIQDIKQYLYYRYWFLQDTNLNSVNESPVVKSVLSYVCLHVWL